MDQVLAGGRGKGHFAKYPKGGVQLLYNAEEIEEAAKGMIGKKYILCAGLQAVVFYLLVVLKDITILDAT